MREDEIPAAYSCVYAFVNSYYNYFCRMENPHNGSSCVKAVGDVLHVNTCGDVHPVEGFELYGPLLKKSLQQNFKIASLFSNAFVLIAAETLAFMFTVSGS